MNISEKIREAAKNLLAEKKVDLVVGFAEGSLPLRSTPYFARTPEQAENLIWSATCENNLANFVRKRGEKVAVVAKGCDVRAIVGLIKEGQINKDNLTILGVPCEGMVDRKQIDQILEGRDLLEVIDTGEELVLKGKGLEKTVAKADVLFGSCQTCQYNTPVIFDQLMGEAVPAKEADYGDIEAFEALSEEERSAFIAKEMQKCIRCYACRQACPMCYCSECFVDCGAPAWIGKSAKSVDDNALFQVVRVLHLAGRCVDCGACERACPMGIKLSILNRKMVKDVKELFGAEAGVNLEDPPALNTHKFEDNEDFML
ncbi:4Fe-4S dicluster domain-containing protein [Desulforamulus ruminis]|uniref:Coenzyme F420 hydrogenase/dehydrogenase beta subunit domain protein n=1 Tax=Desulforamulus ruminis (strain ATCC 23193 / DSM 2154 / NCIMB 8452 / DL) TaxID=696281 RepID=F6DMU9_DESRL|nr:4Fe-4S dicluster domain-containing protein [Desulforamulus ruminis]AEG58507.1 coenzyme F420 hydrogenase/dehydrogenase beta subunit domain protein [Desulforamulus ruminis DSM 2154]AEG58514.1 coenzyme F420 hydrogenase/dehydrogenase beta subunit domain protein [Desulforamulus ruminis DSM 2154]